MKTCPVCNSDYPNDYKMCPIDGAVLMVPISQAASKPVRRSATRVSPRKSKFRLDLLLWSVLLIAFAVAGVIEWLNLRPPTAAPVLSPAGGVYDTTQTVSISDETPGAVIHYTLDGSEPTGASPAYTQPLTFLSGTVVRAMATAPGYKQSEFISGEYRWNSPDAQALGQTGSSAYAQGKSAYGHKKYTEARKFFEAACGNGEMKACNDLGYLYAQGLGGAQDMKGARTVYQKACDNGNFSSCASLGVLYQDERDSANARKYLEKACNGGVGQACGLLREVH